MQAFSPGQMGVAGQHLSVLIGRLILNINALQKRGELLASPSSRMRSGHVVLPAGGENGPTVG